MANAGASSRGMIAVDKMGGKVLFLNPATYETEIEIDLTFQQGKRQFQQQFSIRRVRK